MLAHAEPTITVGEKNRIEIVRTFVYDCDEVVKFRRVFNLVPCPPLDVLVDPINRHRLGLKYLFGLFGQEGQNILYDAARLVGTFGESVKRLRDGEFELGGRLPVNPSGGTLCTNAIAVTAMARVAETALQVWGRAGAHQQGPGQLRRA